MFHFVILYILTISLHSEDRHSDLTPQGNLEDVQYDEVEHDEQITASEANEIQRRGENTVETVAIERIKIARARFGEAEKHLVVNANYYFFFNYYALGARTSSNRKVNFGIAVLDTLDFYLIKYRYYQKMLN